MNKKKAIILIIIFIFLNGSLFEVQASKERSFLKFTGLIQTLDQLTHLEKKESQKKIKLYPKNFVMIDHLNLKTDLKVAPYFMRSIILHSDQRYMNLIEENQCTFYSLLENNLLKNAKGAITEIPVFYINDQNTKNKFRISKKNFLRHIYKKKCTINKDTSFLFNAKNIKKTLSNLKYPAPKNFNECAQILSLWRKNLYLPYICSNINKIMIGENALKQLKNTSNQKNISTLKKQARKAAFLKKELPLNQRSYLKNLCLNLDTPRNFCSQYISKDTWSKVVHGELPSYFLKYKCKNMLKKKDKLTMEDLGRCAQKFQITPKICISKGSVGFISRLPHPNCKEIAEALEFSHLKTDYHDCPSLIDNEAIINTVRISNHFSTPKDLSTSKNCADNVNNTFANLNIDFNNEKAWPLKICYVDRAIEEKVCKSYIPGNNNKSKLSESIITGNILYKTLGAPSNTKCLRIEKKSFNPTRTKFKMGCFIVYDQFKCNNFYCPRKIYYNEKIIEDITYEGIPYFDYFKTSFTNEKFALANILNETFKIKSTQIRNISDLTFFLKKFPNGIIHGIGCLEDIQFDYYQKVSFNACTPIPFIIDGIRLDEKKGYYLTLRLPIDDIHSPRLIRWNHIFSSLSTYQKLHPLQTWTLYGIKKKN